MYGLMYFGSACTAFSHAARASVGFDCFWRTSPRSLHAARVIRIDFHRLLEILLRGRPFLVRHRVHALAVRLLGRLRSIQGGGRDRRAFMQAHPLQHDRASLRNVHLSRAIALQPDRDRAHIGRRGIIRPRALVHQVLHAAVPEGIHNHAFLHQPFGKGGNDLRRSRKRRAVFGDDRGVVGLRRSRRQGRALPGCQREGPDLFS